MDKSPRPAQPVRQDMQSAQQGPHLQATGQPSDGQPKKLGRANNKWLKKILTVAIVAVLILLLSLVGYYSIKQFNTAQPDKDAYQAVFLSNGQVYFGKLDKVNNKNYVQMSNIYYLQVDQELQAESSKPKDSKAAKQDAEGGMQLIKLGDELHGPTDKMQIKSSQVLFWEDLKADSKVAEAITSYSK